MKRHKFTKWNKERISVYTSAALVVGVCVLSGLYAVGQSPSKTQILDMESVGENSVGEAADAQAENDQSEVVLTSGATESPMLRSQTLAEEYAKRTEEERKKRMEETADLTGDADISEESEQPEKPKESEKPAEPVVQTTTSSTTKIEQVEPHFSLEEGMSWPVQGNVILSYSMDERVYLASLNEYRYYPAIAISAAPDTAVCAAAKGRVENIGFNEEIGQYMTVNLGDGYVVTYGQLKDITAEQGDIVSRGQIIGYLAEPTKYYSVEGTNLYMKMEHEGESMDPVLYFQ